MRLRFLLVGFFFALTAVAVCSNSYLELTSRMFVNPTDYGFDVRQQVGRLVVGGVWASGPATTLRSGDEIVSVDGENIRYQTDLITAFRRHQPQSSYSIVVRRDGQLLHFTLRQASRSLRFYIRRFIFIFVPACFLLMGLIVFLLKPNDRPALLLGLWFAAMSNPFPAELYLLLPPLLMWVLVASSLLRWFLLPLCLHFFLIFPEESPLLRRFPRLEWYLYVPFLLFFLPLTGIYLVLWAISPDRAVAFSQSFPLFFPTQLLGFAYFAAGILSLIINYRRASLPSRRKVRVILAATIAGFLPGFIWYAVTLLFGHTRVGMWVYSWAVPVVLMAVLLVPPAYAYAILRHRVIPISLIIRRGVQYLLAKNVLRLLIALPLIGLALTVLTNPNRTLSDILLRNSLYFYVTLMIAAAISSVSYTHLTLPTILRV